MFSDFYNLFSMNLNSATPNLGNSATPNHGSADLSELDRSKQ